MLYQVILVILNMRLFTCKLSVILHSISYFFCSFKYRVFSFKVESLDTLSIIVFQLDKTD